MIVHHNYACFVGLVVGISYTAGLSVALPVSFGNAKATDDG